VNTYADKVTVFSGFECFVQFIICIKVKCDISKRLKENTCFFVKDCFVFVKNFLSNIILKMVVGAY
jgi:hypothetical protein